MGRFGLGLLAGLAAMAVVPASAADLARPVYKAPPAPAAVFNWTGLYVGGHVGYGWAKATTEDVVDFHLKPKGAFGGGQIGYNYQFESRVVLGLEADASFGDLKADSRIVHVLPFSDTVTDIASFKIDTFGTVRGRLGYAFDRFLPYVTGGFAWARTRMDYSQPVTLFGLPFGSLAEVHEAKTRTGWTIGGGAEYALADHWSIKAEYLYLDFDDADYAGRAFVGPTSGAPFEVSTRLKIHTAKVGLNYRF